MAKHPDKHGNLRMRGVPHGNSALGTPETVGQSPFATGKYQRQGPGQQASAMALAAALNTRP